MKILKYILLLLFIICLHQFVHAQEQKTVADIIADKIDRLGEQKPEATLFVHFDKTIYSNSENAWFTGYILKSNTLGEHHTLCLALIRNDDRSVLTSAKYVMDKGLAMGNMVLPDSLPTGNYSFICYTNLIVNGYPSALFVQPITIKSGNAKGFIANLSLTDSIKPGMDSAKVLLKAYTKDVTLLKKAAVKYFIGDRAHPTHKGNLITDNFGEATIPVPLKEITPANNILQAEIDNGKEIKNFTIRLPVYKKETLVKFYPEGGHLINEIINTIGWEVTNNEMEPLQVKALLYENDQLLQTVQTNAYGMGKFYIVPQKGSRYYVKINASDSEYILPKPLAAGPVIAVNNALTADTLILNVNTQAVSGNLFLLVHDHLATFINSAVAVTGKSMVIKIPLTEVPKGIAAVTVLDSAGRPFAERLFFAHYDKRAIATITTDTAIYKERQKVTLKLKLADAQQHPLPGLVSVACVQNNRLDVLKSMNIEQYTYITHELAAVPFKKELMGSDAESKDFLEQLLLIKGWSRFTWLDIEHAGTVDTLPQYEALTFRGKVALNKKNLKKPVSLNLKKFISSKFSELEYISTDSFGRFELQPEKITSEPNKKFEITVNNDRQDEYTISVIDPYVAMNKMLAASLYFPDYSPRSFTQTSQTAILKSNEVVKTLTAVVVTAKKDNSFFAARSAGTNACGDYVCLNGILNCTNHPNDIYQPVVGRSYGVRSSGGSSIHNEIYYGCSALTREINNAYRFSMEGIYNKKEFYVVDMSKVDATDPQFLSTIYWNHAILTDKEGNAEISFYTSDIPGRFRIIIQGVTFNNVVYGEHFIDVKEE